MHGICTFEIRPCGESKDTPEHPRQGWGSHSSNERWDLWLGEDRPRKRRLIDVWSGPWLLEPPLMIHVVSERPFPFNVSNIKLKVSETLTRQPWQLLLYTGLSRNSGRMKSKTWLRGGNGGAAIGLSMYIHKKLKISSQGRITPRHSPEGMDIGIFLHCNWLVLDFRTNISKLVKARRKKKKESK